MPEIFLPYCTCFKISATEMCILHDTSQARNSLVLLVFCFKQHTLQRIFNGTLLGNRGKIINSVVFVYTELHHILNYVQGTSRTNISAGHLYN